MSHAWADAPPPTREQVERLLRGVTAILTDDVLAVHLPGSLAATGVATSPSTVWG